MSQVKSPPHALPLEQVIDLLLDAVVIVDAEGRYVYVSAAYERIFGYAPEEVIGRQMIHLVHPEDRDKTMAAVREIMAGQDKTTLENRYIRKDGEVVHIMWSARWVPEHGVRIAVARDVSARVRAEATQAAVYAISEAAQAAGSLQSLYRTIHHVLGGLLPAGNCSRATCRRSLTNWRAKKMSVLSSKITVTWDSPERDSERVCLSPGRPAMAVSMAKVMRCSVSSGE